MALADSGRAIGAVTRALHDHLLARLSTVVDDVTVGKPEPVTNGLTNPRLNLFLYEVQFDPHLRNVSLDTGQPPPLWLVLKYLLTAFDEGGESDSEESHEIMGQGVRTLQELAYLPLMNLPATALAALGDNPEPLKLTFDPSSPDLLSRLMQGTDEKYRCSVAFEVRPVMIATGELPSYSLLVGIDYTAGGAVIGEAGIQRVVIPSMGPTLTSLSPTRFGPGDILTLRGDDLHLAALAVDLGPVTLAITAQGPDRILCQVNGSIPDGAVISAGSHAISVSYVLPNGRRRRSNLLVGGLMPVLSNAAPGGLTHIIAGDLTSPVFGHIDLTGVLLGTDRDDVFVALYRAGSTVRVFDQFQPLPGPPGDPQTGMRLVIPDTAPVPPGPYQVIVRVNGQQARNSPTVNLV